MIRNVAKMEEERPTKQVLSERMKRQRQAPYRVNPDYEVQSRVVGNLKLEPNIRRSPQKFATKLLRPLEPYCII